MKIRKTYLIGALLLMLCLNIAYAQDVGQGWQGSYEYGKLIDVEATGEGPIAGGRYEYTVTLKKTDGTTVNIVMWMTTSDAAFLTNVKGRWISLYYTQDAQDRNIYSHHYTHTPQGVEEELLLQDYPNPPTSNPDPNNNPNE